MNFPQKRKKAIDGLAISTGVQQKAFIFTHQMPYNPELAAASSRTDLRQNQKSFGIDINADGSSIDNIFF